MLLIKITQAYQEISVKEYEWPLDSGKRRGMENSFIPGKSTSVCVPWTQGFSWWLQRCCVQLAVASGETSQVSSIKYSARSGQAQGHPQDVVPLVEFVSTGPFFTRIQYVRER